ncbi:MAG: DUF2969 domain-containing protein [Limosilactobacillus gorillae]|jgi:hypothetical protein|uniref:DUF2969 domain-containing protein n=1 Tax=Limosilactobacillus gorillae TaxID=1450649 RepID=UPI000A4B46CA|nr:DUF2969 domain-containing protein [Limosilactobacillus gorillae]MDO4854968.1 DUF2969 domain-containing protein [Limosilactobacillus gorillae]
MTKKAKAIEVSVQDSERNHQAIQQVFIGRRLIGEVLPDNGRFKAVMLKDETEFRVRSQEEGLETILQQYHLHQH